MNGHPPRPSDPFGHAVHAPALGPTVALLATEPAVSTWKAELASDLLAEVERFRALPAAARRELAALEAAVANWERAAEALRLFVASQPCPDHPGLASPAFAAMRDALPLIRSAIDEAAGRPKRTDVN